MTGMLIGLGLTTLALKAAGPLAIGEQTLPERVRQVVDSAVVAVLIVLVVVGAFTDANEFVLDARGVGLVAAGLAIWRDASIPRAVAIAIVATALTRAIT
jgi:hypothetical protein